MVCCGEERYCSGKRVIACSMDRRDLVRVEICRAEGGKGRDADYRAIVGT